MPSDSEVFFSLLRISAAQILRAAGHTSCKPSVLDAFTDILARYLMLLGTTTRDMAESNNRVEPELSDVRQALEHVGLIRPMNIYDDDDDSDTTGLEALIEWFKGGQAAEIRRVAGFAVPEVGVPGAVGVDGTLPSAAGTGVVSVAGAGVSAGTAKNEEWLAALKKISEKRGGP